MSDFMAMTPSNQTFAELLSNGTKYNIPKFQRDYSWEKENWEDLWTDIETLDEEGYHYMGYIVIQSRGDNYFEVIDGQQRLITLSIVVLSAMKHLKYLIDSNKEVEHNQERLNVFHDRFIGAKNSITLNVENKLSLNRNNNKHFRNLCSTLDKVNERNLSKTNKLLNDMFSFFVSKINCSNGMKIAEFIEKVTSKMIFTKIITQDSINAYKIFETLNARGVQLSTPDLLKNHIFSTLTVNDDVTDEVLNHLDEDWSTIIEQLGENNFTDFVRYHYNMQRPFTQKKLLFKSLKQMLNTPQLASGYLTSLKEYATVFSSLLNPEDEWWSQQEGDYKDARNYLKGLKLFGIKQPFQILMIAFTKFDAKEFILTLKYIYKLSIRYNIICHNSANEQEKRYNKIAISIFNDKLSRASHIKNSEEFKGLYPDDEELKGKFEHLKIPSRRSAKKIRFLLTDIENSEGRKVNYLDTTLEHICPYNPNENWQKQFGSGVNEINDRLGNLILLERDNLKRSSFEEKKEMYKKTNFKLANKVAEYESWDIETLNRYQTWLAKEAVKTWRID